MQRLRTLIIIAATLTLLVTTIPIVKAVEWWQLRNITETQRAAELNELSNFVNVELPRLMNPVPSETNTTVEEQLSIAREFTSLANQNMTTMETTNTTKKTVDDGYVYPKNATDEEKAKIDSQQRYLWEKAGRPGEPQIAPDDDNGPNPYCDQVSDEYMRNGGVCHDRKDASDITGLYTCNDGTHKEHWQDCRDATRTTTTTNSS